MLRIYTIVSNIRFMEGKELDRVFYALSDSKRRSIIEMLSEKEMTVSQIANSFSISLVGVSKHIKVLEHAGLIEVLRIGRVKQCRLNGPKFKRSLKWMNTYGTVWRASEKRLELELQKSKKKE